MFATKPQAVIFDMDGLILDTEVIYRTAWQQSATEFGYSMSDEFYLCFVGRRSVDCESILFEAYGSDFPLSDFLARGAQLYGEHFKVKGIPTKSGLHELLDFLDDRKLPRAVATSTGRTNALYCLGDLAERFTHIVTGDEVANGKPAPDIFLLAAERLGVAPQHCLVLEDAEAGVQAAHAASIPVIVVPDLKQPTVEMIEQAICACSSLHEVQDLLMKR